ncbi:MAG: FAS1-like dehydratase domain-containing protein [Pseudonocardiaceae bacterium]
MTNNAGTRPDQALTADDEIGRLVRGSRRVVGCLAPDVEPGVDVASWINVSRFVEATGDENPLYTDVQYGAGSLHHTMLAPPTFVLAVRMPDSVGGLDLTRYQLVDAVKSLRFSWDDTIRLADTLGGRVHVADISQRFDEHGRRRGYVSSTADYERNGVAFARGACDVEFAPRAGDGSAFPARPIYRYGPAEVEKMVQELESEQPPRGAIPRFWSDTSLGETPPTVLKGPLTLADLMVWTFAQGRPVRAGNLHHTRLAGLTGRQVTNPVTAWPSWDRTEAWLDSAAAHTGGLSAPAAPGGLLCSLAGQYVTHWMGDDGFLRQLSVDIVEPLFYGDALRLTGTVVDRFVVTDDVSHRYYAVTIRLTGNNQLDEVVVAGEAVVFLPDRGKPAALPVVGGLTCELPGEDRCRHSTTH